MAAKDRSTHLQDAVNALVALQGVSGSASSQPSSPAASSGSALADLLQSGPVGRSHRTGAADAAQAHSEGGSSAGGSLNDIWSKLARCAIGGVQAHQDAPEDDLLLRDSSDASATSFALASPSGVWRTNSTAAASSRTISGATMQMRALSDGRDLSQVALQMHLQQLLGVGAAAGQQPQAQAQAPPMQRSLSDTRALQSQRSSDVLALLAAQRHVKSFTLPRSPLALHSPPPPSLQQQQPQQTQQQTQQQLLRMSAPPVFKPGTAGLHVAGQQGQPAQAMPVAGQPLRFTQQQLQLQFLRTPALSFSAGTAGLGARPAGQQGQPLRSTQQQQQQQQLQQQLLMQQLLQQQQQQQQGSRGSFASRASTSQRSAASATPQQRMGPFKPAKRPNRIVLFRMNSQSSTDGVAAATAPVAAPRVQQPLMSGGAVPAPPLAAATAAGMAQAAAGQAMPGVQASTPHSARTMQMQPAVQLALCLHRKLLIAQREAATQQRRQARAVHLQQVRLQRQGSDTPLPPAPALPSVHQAPQVHTASLVRATTQDAATTAAAAARAVAGAASGDDDDHHMQFTEQPADGADAEASALLPPQATPVDASAALVQQLLRMVAQMRGGDPPAPSG